MPLGNDPSTGPQPSTAETLTDFGPGDVGLSNSYRAEIRAADKENHEWKRKAERVVLRYRDERTNSGFATQQKRYNILWSIINTTMPAIYGKPPQPTVMRRYTDPDQVARVASLILERTLEFQLSSQSDFHPAIKAALQDRLLPGMGCAWVRYQKDQTSPTDTVDNDYYARLCGSLAAVDFVYWEDFGYSPARTWEEVPLVWRIVYMTRDQLVDRFGEEKGKACPLDYKPARHGDGSTSSNETDEPKNRVFKQARIYELWDKRTSKVFWLHTAVPGFLDQKDDPIRFPGFFPCPKPMFATNTTGNLTPVPDYVMYQDQANEIDLITQRLYMLTTALKVVGVYDASQVGVQRMLTEGVDNQLIPIDTWAAFAEKGGIKGVVDFLPLDVVITTVDKLYTIRGQLVEDIYQITGLSDIIRGASNPNETLGAQKIKAQFASVRLDALKGELARFVTDILRLMGHIIVQFFDDQTIIAQSAIMQSPDGQKAVKDAQAAQQKNMQAMMAQQQAAPPPPGLPGPPSAPGAPGAMLPPGGPPPGLAPQQPPMDPAMMQPAQPADVIHQALELLRKGQLLDYRICVAADSMVEPDLQEEQTERTAFLTAVTQFLQQALPAAEANPKLLPMMQALLMFGIRGFRAGQEIEGILDATFNDIQNNPQPPKPDPKAEALKAKGALDAQAQQADMQKMQQEFALKQQEQAGKMEAMHAELQAKIQAMHEETQAQVQAILIKANVEAKVAQDKAAADAQLAAQEQQVSVDARAQDMAMTHAEHQMGMEHMKETNANELDAQHERNEAAGEKKGEGE